MTPFEFVLIFFIGGLALTAMVGDEVSFTNAICQIISIGFAHYTLAWARSRSQRLARLVDGTPLILLEHKAWRTHTLRHMRISDDDVMVSARDSGLDSGAGGPCGIRAQRRDQYFSHASNSSKGLESRMAASHSKRWKNPFPRSTMRLRLERTLIFQRKWWRFENFVWVIFSLIILLDLCGVFGRRPVAKVERRSGTARLTSSTNVLNGRSHRRSSLSASGNRRL